MESECQEGDSAPHRKDVAGMRRAWVRRGDKEERLGWGFLQDGRTLRSKMNDVLGRVVKRKMGSIGEREKGAGALEDFKDQAERGD